MGGWYSGRLVGYGEKERVLRGSEWRMGREEEEEDARRERKMLLGSWERSVRCIVKQWPININIARQNCESVYQASICAVNTSKNKESTLYGLFKVLVSFLAAHLFFTSPLAAWCFVWTVPVKLLSSFLA